MGTNYYAHKNICPHCGKGDDPIHIGKSSGGWTFNFHGTEEIKSWADWQKELNKPETVIKDECGNVISFEQFMALVESKRQAKFNHARDIHDIYSPYQQHMLEHYGRYDESGLRYGKFNTWLDAEGNSFSGGEFC